jgi:transposase
MNFTEAAGRGARAHAALSLVRGGDRQLNRALHTVILHRRQHDPATKDYITRRLAEGKSARDATRILKRYLARHLYRVMQNTPTRTT